MSDLQDRMQALLDSAVEQGRERGMQLAVYLGGELIVDAWAGHVDPLRTRPVDGDTLFPVFSTSKGVTATLIHRLAERDLLDYDTPIATYWPEFAARGKEHIPLRWALNHSSGIPQMPELSVAEMCDWRTITSAVAELEPLWEPGTRQEYHAITYGWILGETACRVTGKSFPQLLREEIAEPLGIKDIYMGIPDEVEPRIAELEEYDREPAAPLPHGARPASVPHWLEPLHAMMNRPDTRRGSSPGTNGIMSARAVAKHYAALLPGGVNGIELLPAERVEYATRLCPPANPAPDAPRLNKGLGYGVQVDEASGRTLGFGHAGFGGSDGFAVPSAKLAVSLTKNLFSQNQSHSQIIKELRESLGL